MLNTHSKLLTAMRVSDITSVYIVLSSTGVVSCPDPTSKEEKGLVNLGRIFGPALRNFHAPIRSLLWHCHVTSLPQECNIAILAVQAKSHTQSC